MRLPKWRPNRTSEADTQELPPVPHRSIMGIVSWSAIDQLWCIDVAADGHPLPASRILTPAFQKHFIGHGRSYYVGDADHEFLVIEPHLRGARYDARTEQAFLNRLRSEHSVYPPTGEPVNWRPEPHFGSFWWLPQEHSWLVTALDAAGQAVPISDVVYDTTQFVSQLADSGIVCWVDTLSNGSGLILHSTSEELNADSGAQINQVLLANYSRGSRDGHPVEWNMGEPM